MLGGKLKGYCRNPSKIWQYFGKNNVVLHLVKKKKGDTFKQCLAESKTDRNVAMD